MLLEIGFIHYWLRGYLLLAAIFAITKLEEVLLKTSLRRPKTDSLEDLNDLQDLITFLPLTTKAMKQAARIWAEAVRGDGETSTPNS